MIFPVEDAVVGKEAYFAGDILGNVINVHQE